MTRLPKRARDMARLVEIKVFPSPGIQLVQAMTFSFSERTNRRLVRSPRKASSIISLEFSLTASDNSPSSDLGASGISARTGILVSISTSSRPSILYLSRPSKYISPTGKHSPSTSAPSMITLVLGDTCPVLRGSSITRALAAVLFRDI